MLEERAHELRVSSNVCELFVNPWSQLFALLQRASCDAGALDVAPHQLIRIEVRRVTGQKVQSQFSLGVGDVFLDHGFLMRRQSVDDQMNRLAAIEHQLLEQCHEQLTAEPTFVRGKPEGALRVDGRRRAHTLPLARTLDNGRFTSRRPGPAMHRISPEARFVPEEDVGVFLAGLPGNGWICVVLPALDCFRVALVSALQRLLRCQVQARQHRTYRRQAQRDIELPLHQLPNQVARPQPEVKSILHWILAINPAQHLLFLRTRELAGAARAFAGAQCPNATSATARLSPDLVRPRAMHPKRCRNIIRMRSLGHALNRQDAHLFKRVVSQAPTVPFHERPCHSHSLKHRPFVRKISDL